MLVPAMPRWMAKVGTPGIVLNNLRGCAAVARDDYHVHGASSTRSSPSPSPLSLSSNQHLPFASILLQSTDEISNQYEPIPQHARSATPRPLRLPCYLRDRDISATAGLNLVRMMDRRRCLLHCKGVNSQYLSLKRRTSYCRRWVVVGPGCSHERPAAQSNT